MCRVVPDRPQQSKLSPALQDVPQQHRCQAQGAQQQPQTTQRLKGRQVGVLDTMKARKPLSRWNGIKTEISELIFEDTRSRRSGFRSHFQEKEAVAALLREQAQKIRLAH